MLAEVDDVDLIDLEPRGGFAVRSGWQHRLLSRNVGWLSFGIPGLKRVRLTRDYDLFVTLAHGCRDVLYASAIDGWKDRCRVSVCWIAELHASCMARAQ